MNSTLILFLLELHLTRCFLYHLPRCLILTYHLYRRYRQYHRHLMFHRQHRHRRHLHHHRLRSGPYHSHLVFLVSYLLLCLCSHPLFRLNLFLLQRLRRHLQRPLLLFRQ